MPAPSGQLSPRPFALFDPATSTWRTSALSLELANLPALAVTWPKRGMWARGIASELPTSAPRTADFDSSLPLVPTPEAKLSHSGIDPGGFNRTENRGTDLASAMALLPTPMARMGRSGGGNGVTSPQHAAKRYAEGRRNMEDWAALLPTPRASDGEKGGPNQRGSSGDLMLPSVAARLAATARTRSTSTTRTGSASTAPMAATGEPITELFPTPMASRSGHNRSPSPGAAVRPSLTRMDKLLPTPTATDANAGRNATANRSNPNSNHHSGETLTDVFWTGPDTHPPSSGGNPEWDAQPQIPLW